MNRVLNVGGGSREIKLQPQYDRWQQVWLDIDPACKPDIVCDARELTTLAPEQFDAVYCSHNLEHYYRHEVPKVLAGIWHVLKADGFAQIMVPDIQCLMNQFRERKLDLDDVLYQSAVGPIMVMDVLWGLGSQIERSGQSFYAHKTGFTEKLLLKTLNRAGFSKIYSIALNMEVVALAFKTEPNETARKLFGLNGGDA